MYADALSRLVRKSCGKGECPDCSGYQEPGVLKQSPPGSEPPNEPDDPGYDSDAEFSWPPVEQVAPVATR